MAIRLSTLAEIKVLSLATLLYEDAGTASQVNSSRVLAALNDMRERIGDPSTLQSVKNVDQFGSREGSLFKTVGIARNVRVDEDFGTQNIYGIGAPTRPRIVPNNFSANVTVERIQLDTRDLNHYITRPEYWYSDEVQRQIGIDDVLLYTFLFLKSKEIRTDSLRTDIYALMPRTSQKAVSNNDVMIAHNVSLIGFKYSYEEAYFDTTNLINETITITDRVV
jgi:hypothetical protein